MYKDELIKRINDNGEEYVEDLSQLSNAKQEAILNDICSYAATLARQAELTMSLILSNFEIEITSDEAVRTLKLTYNYYDINKFHLIVNVNYWLSLATLNTGFDIKSAVLKEKVTSFYLLHLMLSPNKQPDIWSLACELQSTQYMTDYDLKHLNPMSVDDVNKLLQLQLPYNLTAIEYYNLLKNDENIEDLLAETKYNNVSFDTNNQELSELDMESLKYNTNYILSDVLQALNNNSNEGDKYWSTFSNKIHSILSVLAPPKPIVDYKMLLRRAIGNVGSEYRKTYKKPNLKKEYIAPTRQTKRKNPHVLIGIDVSASHSDKDLITTIGEISHIKNARITVAQFDYAIVSKTTYKHKAFNKKLADGFKINGRGGTDFKEITDEFESNIYSRKNPNGYSFLLIFTDGYAETTPLRNHNLINKVKWILTSNSTDKYILNNFSQINIIKI